MLLPLAPVSLIVQLFDAFLAFSLLFGSFLLYVQEGSAASIQVDMQIEAAARLKSTVSDLPALEITYYCKYVVLEVSRKNQFAVF